MFNVLVILLVNQQWIYLFSVIRKKVVFARVNDWQAALAAFPWCLQQHLLQTIIFFLYKVFLDKTPCLKDWCVKLRTKFCRKYKEINVSYQSLRILKTYLGDLGGPFLIRLKKQ